MKGVTHLDGKGGSVVANGGATLSIRLRHLAACTPGEGSKIPDLPQSIKASGGIEALREDVTAKHVRDTR